MTLNEAIFNLILMNYDMDIIRNIIYIETGVLLSKRKTKELLKGDRLDCYINNVKLYNI
jgi:hypothetical protein